MRMLLKLFSTLNPLTKASAAAPQKRHSIGSKKPSNWKPSTLSLRTESARSLPFSTWRTRRKFQSLVSPSTARERQAHADSMHDPGGHEEGY